MLNNYPTATKCVYLVSNLWLLSPVGLSNHSSFLLTIFYQDLRI